MERKPDINQLYKVLRRETPDRPTLFELFLNKNLYEHLTGEKEPGWSTKTSTRFLAKAFSAAGYDYLTSAASSFYFPTKAHSRDQTISLNEGAPITDKASFDAYVWPEVADFDNSAFDVADDLPNGMKIMVITPGGVLENTISLMGYDNLCIALYDEPELVSDVFENVGKRLLAYYKCALEHKTVGLVMANDDWGFNTQTMLPPAQLREYVFPWHKQIVDLAHAHGLPAVLHSCGYFGEVMDDVIAMGFDGKHSYEDNILPVEESYKKWHDGIAILGGLDLDFIVTKTPDEVYARAKAMLDLGKTGYALGTGNSVPEYVPFENYFAMTKAALEG